MDKFGRLSRRDRQKVHHHNKIIVLIPLAAILIFLFIFFFKAIIWEVTIPTIWDKLTGKSHQVLADSLVNTALRRFNLSEFPLRDSIPDESSRENQDIKALVSQNWPQDLDFIFFSKLLTEISIENDMACECLESKDGRMMTCEVIRRGGALSRVRLIKSENTRLLLFKAALIFENLGGFDIETLTSMLNAGMSFSYFGNPASVPSREIKSKMSHAGISTILILPSKNDDWAQLAVNYAANPAPRGKVDRFLVDAFLLSDVFKSHPNVIAFRFDSDSVDPAIALEGINYAVDNGMAYYYENDIPNSADSMAFSKNLKMVKLSYNFLRGGLTGSLKNHILAELFGQEGVSSIAIKIDAKLIRPQEILWLQSQMDDIGIKLISCNELLRSVESF